MSESMDETPLELESLADGVKYASEWMQYAEALAEANRFFVSDSAYFESLVAECLACEVVWADPVTIFRARIHPVRRADDTTPLPPDQVGAPTPEQAVPNRLNPEGMPYFYSALDVPTAIAESRPWKGARISVGKFLTHGRLRIIDLSNVLLRRPPLHRAKWAGFMMQQPVHREDRRAYVGTQYLSERLKAEGMDGIAYGSSLLPGGTNVALFNPIAARLVGREVHEVMSVAYRSVPISPPTQTATELLTGLMSHDG